MTWMIWGCPPDLGNLQRMRKPGLQAIGPGAAAQARRGPATGCCSSGLTAYLCVDLTKANFTGRFYAPDKGGSCMATCLLLGMVGHEALHVQMTRFSTNKDVQGQFRGNCTQSMLARRKYVSCLVQESMAPKKQLSQAQKNGDRGLKGHIKGFKMSWSRA